MGRITNGSIKITKTYPKVKFRKTSISNKIETCDDGIKEKIVVSGFPLIISCLMLYNMITQNFDRTTTIFLTFFAILEISKHIVRVERIEDND